MDTSCKKYVDENFIHIYPPILKEQGEFYGKLLDNIIYAEWKEGNGYSELNDKLFGNCAPSQLSYINMDRHRYDDTYHIIYNNPNVTAMITYHKYDIGPNYRSFNSMKDVKKFFNTTKHPIHRIILKHTTRYKDSFDFSQLKSWDSIPESKSDTYIVMYYDISKLSWIKNKVQLLAINYNLPKVITDTVKMKPCIK